MAERLVTRHLVLRPLETGDATGLHAFFSDPEAMRMWGPVHADVARTQAWVEAALSGARDQTLEYAILRNGEAIGRAGIWRAGEIGFFLRRDCWGQGLMREALGALLPQFFDRLGLTRIVADVDASNLASMRVLTSLGFVETGREAAALEVNGEMTDSVYFALDRS